MYNQNYDVIKSRIMSPIELFNKRLNHRLDDEVKAAVKGCRNALVVLVGCLIAAGVLVAFILTILYKNYVKPLNSYTNQLKNREKNTKDNELNTLSENLILRIRPKGALELREFGRIYNRMANVLALEMKKSHDAWTEMKKAKEERDSCYIFNNGKSPEVIRKGFDEEYSDKLFNVFQRLHSSSEFEGSGVGLAIVKKVMQRHGGAVAIRGSVGKGVTITLTFRE